MEIVFERVSCDKLCNISFQIKKGTIIGVTGCQSTMFLKMINYKIPIDGTAIYNKLTYNDHNISQIRKKMSLVEKNFKNEFLASTVEEYMMIFIRYYKIKIEDPKKKVTSALKMVGLTEDDLKKQLIHLSSSEQKLLQIAISLLSNPDVLLLDEPFVTLDMKSQKKIERLLLKLKERYQKTIFIASQNSDLLYKITEYMIFLKDNTIIKKGETKTLYQDVNFLKKLSYEIPDIVLFTHKAKELKNVKIDYHKDIRDLIKDVYKHV